MSEALAIFGSTVVRRRRAFTLIELLVVIGIIGVLLGILLPTLRASRAQAQMVMCTSNLRQIYNGLLAYAYDNRDHFPDDLTLGQHPFRAAAGRTMPGRSVFPESYGLPALLQGLPPGAQPVFPMPKARYLPGDCNVWMCPSADERIAKWGNTYAWTRLTSTNVVRNYTTIQRHRLVINDDGYLKHNREDYLGGVPTFVFDNVNFGAGLTGNMGPFSGTSGADPYTFPTKLRNHVNYRKGYTGAINTLTYNGEVWTQLVK